MGENSRSTCFTMFQYKMMWLRRKDIVVRKSFTHCVLRQILKLRLSILYNHSTVVLWEQPSLGGRAMIESVVLKLSQEVIRKFRRETGIRRKIKCEVFRQDCDGVLLIGVDFQVKLGPIVGTGFWFDLEPYLKLFDILPKIEVAHTEVWFEAQDPVYSMVWLEGVREKEPLIINIAIFMSEEV